MSTQLQERIEKIHQILEELAADSARGYLVIVEGQKDQQALRELGISGKIITAKTSRKSFLDLTAEIEKEAPKEVILLFDFDRRGKELTKRLAQHLETSRAKTETHTWKRLKALTGHDIKDIESIPTYLQTLSTKLT